MLQLSSNETAPTPEPKLRLMNTHDERMHHVCIWFAIKRNRCKERIDVLGTGCASSNTLYVLFTVTLSSHKINFLNRLTCQWL